MNDYLELELIPNKNAPGGSFVATADFSIDIFATRFRNIDVKIDTGCSVSVINTSRLRIPSILSMQKKTVDIISNTPFLCSYGVETGGNKHSIPNTFDEKIACDAIKFKHVINALSIDGVYIPAKEIYVNYNRKSNILIGMDILSLMENHIGVSNETGKLIFLACPYGKFSKEYDNALKRHFGLQRS